MVVARRRETNQKAYLGGVLPINLAASFLTKTILAKPSLTWFDSIPNPTIPLKPRSAGVSADAASAQRVHRF